MSALPKDSKLTSESQSARDYLKKICDLKHVLSTDLIGADIKWTLFVTAAQSYRYDSQLKPFPPKFFLNNVMNIELLIHTINNTPALKVLLDMITDENYDELDVEVVELLHWVLVTEKDPVLRTVKKSEFENILSKVPQEQPNVKPTHIFEIYRSSNSKAETKFDNYRAEYKSNYAFHGSKLDSFHSILNHGLHQHMCKSALYGEGIYLSSELSVSLNYSPNGAAWGASACGSFLSCVAVCEYIEHPEHLHCHVKAQKKSKVPEKYFVITNNDILRIRYLLVFSNTQKKLHTTKSIALAWISRNRYLLSVCCYTLLLTSIGVANSGNGLYIRHLISKKTSHFLELIRKTFYDE